MYELKYDPSKSGLNSFFKDYQILAFQVICSKSDGVTSKVIWDEVNERLVNKSISRASIINFLEAMRMKGILRGEETTGKGGKYFIYSIDRDETEFKEYLAKIVIEHLVKNFPDETKIALSNVSG